MGTRGWTREEIETAARMYANGELLKSIGAVIGKHPDTVGYYIRRHPEMFISESERKGLLQGKKVALPIPRYTRRCHDCGRPTTDYRCPRCWAHLRRTGGYSPTGEVSDMDTVAYGTAQ